MSRSKSKKHFEPTFREKLNEYQKMVPPHFIDFETFLARYSPICDSCGFPEFYCDCREYDNEGSEI